MTGHITSIRPARAAIAAVLALSATPVLAQVAAPPPVEQAVTPDATVAPPVATMAPAPAASAAPAAPVFAPSQPVVQSTPSAEENRAAAMAAAEAEAAARPAPAPRRAASPVAQAPVERVATTTAPVTRTQTPVAVTPPAAETAPVAPVAPMVAEQEEAPVAATPVTEAVAENPAQTDNALLWAMGGAALLLAGLGGTALMRRRRPADAVEEEAVFVTTPVVTPREAILPRPVMVPTPAMPTPAHSTPFMAASAPDREHDDVLEAMVAAAPSDDNPFRTRAKRMRRAQYLLAQRAERPASAAPVMQTPAARAEPAPAVDRSQTVYRYGGATMRPGGLKPRTR